MEHNIDALRIRFKHLLDNLCDDYCFADYIMEGTPEDIDCSWLEANDAMEALDIWTGAGATKFVIGTDDCDYVIKFQPPCVDAEYNYCQREAEVYREAQRRGYADKFAWTDHLFDYSFIYGDEEYVIPVYIMEWCQCSYEMIYDDADDYNFKKFCTSRGLLPNSDDSREKYDNSKCGSDDHERIMAWAFSVWGLNYNEPKDRAIVDFMREMFINDIHAGNWGWCNNQLVLVDYSGYGSNYNERSMNY